MHQQPLPGSRKMEFQNGVSIFVFLCRALALSVEVFLHRLESFGERYIGLQAGAAVLLMLFFPICCEGQSAEPLLFFLACFLFMCICVRARVHLRRKRGGSQPHTLYTGTPRLMRVFRRMPEEKVKGIVEPLLTFLVGALALGLSQTLGCYLILASLGLLVSTNLTLGYERKRALDMHDAFIEQRGASERFRDLRGE